MEYLILSVGRARSGVLAAYLREIGCGKPDEFFEVARFVILRDTLRATELREFIETHRHNGIFGMRLVWSHVSAMYHRLGIGIHAFVKTFLPEAKFIFVTRDPFRQAIESAIEACSQPDPEAPPLKWIEGRVAQIITGYQAWEDYFQCYGIHPHRIRAEDYAEDPMHMRTVADFLGYDSAGEVLTENRFDDDLTTHPLVGVWYRKCLHTYISMIGEACHADFD